MRRMILTVGVLGAALLAASPASAQGKLDLGEKGQFILSADRLMPLFSYQSFKTGDDNNSDSTSSSNISFVTSNLTHRTVFDVPRLALDYAVIDSLTVGGSVFVGFDVGSDVTQKRNGTSTSTDGAKTNFFGFAPRVGYVLNLTHNIAFWPRGGLSYIRRSTTIKGQNDAEETTSANQFALDIEPMFVISPAQHFGITIGPNIDIPLTGTAKNERKANGRTDSSSVDSTQFYFGINAGLLGYF
ncbi:hypothetical protein [Pendulispora albinea]|uniref:Outer membrane protein beta-barrel domain-containing protein n=1 Tax=Pendulispora albinea TaxID=2741071 RepID=A0ABZ2LYE8_9BACT